MLGFEGLLSGDLEIPRYAAKHQLSPLPFWRISSYLSHSKKLKIITEDKEKQEVTTAHAANKQASIRLTKTAGIMFPKT